VDVYTTRANGKQELEVKPGLHYDVDGVNVYYFNRWTKGHSNFSPQLLRSVFLNCRKYDVIHIQSWWNLVAVLSTIVCILKGKTPVISTRGSLTNFTFQYRRNLLKRFTHFVIGKKLLEYSIIHVTSLQEKKETEQFVRPRKIFVIDNLISFPTEPSPHLTKREYLKLVFVGRIDPAKNLEFLIHALDTKVTIPFSLNIIGEGDEQYVGELKGKNKNQSHIQWLGNIDGVEKFSMMADADLLLLPSRTENFGNVVFEALSQGTPVMISENVGAKDFVRDHSLGWVIDFNAINALWSKPEALLEIRKKAPGIIARQFNPEHQVAEYIHMYREVMEVNA